MLYSIDIVAYNIYGYSIFIYFVSLHEAWQSLYVKAKLNVLEYNLISFISQRKLWSLIVFL